MYDRFNDKYRYVPLNADLAGLMVNTATVADPWYSPAGLNRGNIRNASPGLHSIQERVIETPFTPTESTQSLLSLAKALFSSETKLVFPLEAHSIESTFVNCSLFLRRQSPEQQELQLFEFNDVVTRTLFTQIVEPFLRDVQSRRGLTDYLVVCDETNNTPAVIDANEFRADIYPSSARSINSSP